MDRGRKRKADADDSAALSSASKRQKFSPETPESTTPIGVKLIETLRSAKDKTGRSITTLFLTLPDKRELPDYYQQIRLPIAIDTVEEKLHRHAYPTLTTVESDLKRMVANAKQYNNDKSEVFGDAERIRKLLSNWMREHNPAYEDPDYTAFPTPIPGEDGANGTDSATPDVAVRDASERPKKPTITLSRGRKTSMPATTQTPEPLSTTEVSSGKTFQQVQEELISDLIKHTDEGGLEIFFPFVNLPSRSLTDYYKAIRHPVSLKSVLKKTRGQHGREDPTYTTDFKSWDAFEDEVSYIWSNCREYNEDGSDMYNLAGEFEDFFQERLAAAKQTVDEPQQPKIKLNARPRPTLHLGAKGSPAPASTPGMAVDNDALARQKQMVKTSVDERKTPQLQPNGVSRSNSQAPAATNGTALSPSRMPGIKSEKSFGPSPGAAPEASQTTQPTGSMPPPPRIPSGSPLPVQHVTHVPLYAPAPPTFHDVFARTTPVTEALLPNLNISSHAQLNLPKPFRLDIPPSPDYTQQSLTIMLPSSQYYLQITPTVSQSLSSGRQYKLFVTVNGVRVTASTKPVINGDIASVTERRQVYDTALNPGVNRIEVEIVAVTGRGGALETEKVSVFANLMRN